MCAFHITHHRAPPRDEPAGINGPQPQDDFSSYARRGLSNYAPLGRPVNDELRPNRRATRRQNSRATEEIRASVRRERIVKGITQEKLAELVDLNIRSVQKIEAGQINVLVTTTMRGIQHALTVRGAS